MVDYEKAGRDAVAALLARGADAAAVGKDVCGLVSRAAAASKEPGPAVAAAVRGAMGAAYLGGQELPELAVAVLASLADVSLMSRVGPEQLMSWVLEGIAGVVPAAGPDARAAIVTKIEERFHGAGEVFTALCEKASSGR